MLLQKKNLNYTHNKQYIVKEWWSWRNSLFFFNPSCNFTISRLPRIRKITTEMTEKDKAWSFWSWLYNFWKIHTPALLSWAMNTLSSSLHRGVFHFRLGIPPRPDKVTQLSSLQMPAPQKETTLLRKLLVIVQLYKQKQKYWHLAKMCFPKQLKGNFQLYSINY